MLTSAFIAARAVINGHMTTILLCVTPEPTLFMLFMFTMFEQEEQLRREGGKYVHLNEDLHVHIETFTDPIDAYYRLSHALYELRRHLVPVNFNGKFPVIFYIFHDFLSNRSF